MPFLRRCRYALVLTIAVIMAAGLAIALASASPHELVPFETLNYLFHPLSAAALFGVSLLLAPTVAGRFPLRRGIGRAQNLEVESQSESVLSVQDGRVLTVFDRSARTVRQSGRLVTGFGAIQQVLVHEQSRSFPIAWAVSLQLAGPSRVLVGTSTDSAAASIVAARIANITGATVAANVGA